MSYHVLENDTLARIGTSCLQQLLESNASKLSVDKWDKVVKALLGLFRWTTPHQLFDENLRVEINEPEQAETTGLHVVMMESILLIPLFQNPLVPSSFQRHCHPSLLVTPKTAKR